MYLTDLSVKSIIGDTIPNVKQKFSNFDIFSTYTAKGHTRAVRMKRSPRTAVRVGRRSPLFTQADFDPAVMVFLGRVVPTVTEVTSSPTYEFSHHPTPIFPCDFKAFLAPKSLIQNQWLPPKDMLFLDKIQSQVF